jgi:GNAT superfamily N-acetyltransferase
MNLRIRTATMEDAPEIAGLIALSARELGRQDYSVEQIEGALLGAWGVDTQLVRDKTYFVVIDGDSIAACGGWSKRKALFGADSVSGAEPALLDPRRDAARIRAFFVHPSWARRGIGKMLLEKCETEARSASFCAAELVATLPGQRLYAACGYESLKPFEYALPNGGSITFVPMRKGKL